MKFICSLIGGLTLLAIPTIAQTTQTSNYFPLEPGNVWMYALAAPGTTSSFRTISVEGRDTLNNIEYSRVRYFERVVYLRANTDGSIVSFNRTTNSEEAWLKLNEPVGTTFDARIDQCVTTGRVEERGAQVTTPAGIFDDTVRLSFQGSCADAGTTQQVYANRVGPVVHEETSFAGPRRYQLVYYRTGSETGGGPEQSFTIGLNALRYRVGTEMRVRLSLRSTLPDSIDLHFPSGQSFDFKIYDETGAIVYVWSADKLFPAIVRNETFGPGERTYGFSVPLGTLPLGRYKAQGYLTTVPQVYLAETAFEIVQSPSTTLTR